LKFRTKVGTLFADKTLYIERLESIQTDFKVMFLRPRRFGKSTFVTTLSAYYDIHTANEFDQLFGALYIGKNPTSSRNKHLVLNFDLSTIDVDTAEKAETSFNSSINEALSMFVEKYEEELGFPDMNSMINTTRAATSIDKVFVSSSAGRQRIKYLQSPY
jgi:hypothetical protein